MTRENINDNTERPDERARARQETIARLNDLARVMGRPYMARTVMTQGVAALPSHELAQIVKEVRSYENWIQGDDPYLEHDFGVLTRVTRNAVTRWTQEPQPDPKTGGERAVKVFFKIDYYAKADKAQGIEAFSYGSENPAKPSVTDRVLTIMLAEDY